MQTVKDMTVQDLKDLIAEVVEEKLRELLGDPDEGLSLRPEVQEYLQRTLTESPDSRQTVSAAELARRMGRDW